MFLCIILFCLESLLELVILLAILPNLGHLGITNDAASPYQQYDNFIV